MTAFTRLTVVGSTRRADIVVPSDEPLVSLVPKILGLLGERPAEDARPAALVRVTGEQLDLSLDSGAQDVGDGEVVRLVRASDAPPPPEVSDVTDAVADVLHSRADLWSASARRSVAAAVLAGSVLLAGTSALDLLGRETAAALPAIALVLALLSIVFGRIGATWSATALTAAGLGLAYPVGATVAASLSSGIAPDALVWTAAAGWAWLALGAGIGIGLRRAPVGWASVVGSGFAVAASILLVTPLGSDGVWGFVGIVALVFSGLLPWYAMTASGLTGLDDQVLSGTLPARARVLVSLTGAYRTLSWTTVAVAVPLGAAAAALASSSNGWAMGLGVAVILVSALRTRAFPLTVQAVALWVAAVVGTVVGVVTQLADRGWIAVSALVVLALLAALFAGIRPVEHVRARLRRLGNVLETCAVISLVPVLLGIFDVYSDLLETF